MRFTPAARRRASGPSFLSAVAILKRTCNFVFTPDGPGAPLPRRATVAPANPPASCPVPLSVQICGVSEGCRVAPGSGAAVPGIRLSLLWLPANTSRASAAPAGSVPARPLSAARCSSPMEPAAAVRHCGPLAGRPAPGLSFRDTTRLHREILAGRVAVLQTTGFGRIVRGNAR